MRFYADENFPKRTIEELRNLGHDVLTAFDDGKANQGIADEDVLARAVELKRLILTHNRLDFRKLHEKNNKHYGIIICTESKDRLELAQEIHAKIADCEKLEGELIRVYRPST